jgi:CRISPR/Cas system-associated exonuclease Cas4 (RecB family)
VRAERNFVIGGGKTLQPALYALAAERILGQKAATGRLYYCTATGGYEERIVPLDAGTRKAVEELAGVIKRALKDGFMPAAPDDRECEYCDYRLVCGPYEPMRLKIKSETSGVRARLADLARLRAMR